MDLRTVPLEHAPPGAAASLLQEEAAAWRDQLHWPRGSFVRRARRLARRGRLQGVLALAGETPAGKLLLGRRHRCVTLDSPWVNQGLRGRGVLEALLKACLDGLAPATRSRRVEISGFLFGEDDPGALLAAHGFSALPRHYLEAALPDRQAASQPPDGLQVGPWVEPPAAAAGLLHAAYRESDDARASDVYTLPSGCADYLETLTSGDDCGRFEPALSVLATEADCGPVGLLVGTWLTAETAHVAQVAVHPRWQGRGLGRTLMQRFHQAARHAGLTRSTLMVSATNTRALAWYRRSGYRLRVPFVSFWRAADPASPST